MRRIKWWVRELGQKAAPKFTLAVLANRTWVLEPEVALVPLMSRRKGCAIDAGANKGVYLYHLARHYRKVAGFEPLPSLATYLQGAAPKNATVHNLALSNVQGTATLSLPKGFNELGSLEAHTTETWTTSAPIEHHQVETRPLDSFGFEDVSFLKIDVEGHEMAVLEGASSTLKLWRPTVLVEVEERHRAGGVAHLRGHMESLGYRGYFVDGNSLRPIADFDCGRDQNLASLTDSVKVGRYINNFMFFNGKDAAERVDMIGAALENKISLDLGAALVPGRHITTREKLGGPLRATRDMLIAAPGRS
jgi:FkbM family methyltransferase